MQIVKATLKANPNNSVIGFKDNSSAIRCNLATAFVIYV
jgi:phosphoribosylformylglycinamidine synthase